MKILDRCGALSGAVGFVLITVGSDVLGTAPGPQTAHPSGQQGLDHLQWLAANTSAQVGVTLELLGFAMSIIFIGYLCTRVRGAGWLATAALAGGTIWIAVKLASGAPVFAAYVLRDEITPQTARLLFDMNGAAFVVTWIPEGIFVACAAAAALMCGVLGRVLGWGGVIVGGATVLLTAVTGVNVLAANFLPFLFCTLWTLLVSLRLGLRRTSQNTSVVAPDAVPVAV